MQRSKPIGYFKSQLPLLFLVSISVYFLYYFEIILVGLPAFKKQIIFLLLPSLIYLFFSDLKFRLYFSTKQFFAAILLGLLLGFSLNEIYNQWIANLTLDNSQTHFLHTNSILKNMLVFGLIPAISEEFYFRGLIQNGLNKHFPILISILISSLFFALVHFNLEALPLYFLLGIILGIFYHLYGIFHVISLHFCYNLASLLYFYYR